MTTETQTAATIEIDLGFIGPKARKLQMLFKGYSTEPNENGYFLAFHNYSHLVVNQGVYVLTNCFESEEQFLETLHSKLLLNF